MLLHAIDAEPDANAHAGDAHERTSTVVLLHGMMGSSESWWRVIPRLTAQGHRVLALDLPGHGQSPRDPNLTIEQAASSVVETVQSLANGHRVAAIGHSYGASVLAEAARELSAELAVYVDASLSLVGGQDRSRLTEQYTRDRRARSSVEDLRASRPFYSERDATVEARAAVRFDPATMASVSCGTDHEWLLDAGSIVIRADPSNWVTDADVARFERRGIDVRSIPGAAHTVWYSHFDEFIASVPELFGTPAQNPLP
ncbi:alpha/beta hydrolase family protein [Microbacterium sp. WCS2018Hpa-23]|uniref:alpha/beta fold hydrolase n=1 Tax=Microbacterium sp. WCS2018Hpa-23 TaxID=3073634 RepID=UPI002883083B|nr:alpha/beta hydrolase family protein [Microbacterium sp. WCS2018Hpa-23]